MNELTIELHVALREIVEALEAAGTDDLLRLHVRALWLRVGGELVDAKPIDRAGLLLPKRIAHALNCARDVCERGSRETIAGEEPALARTGYAERSPRLLRRVPLAQRWRLLAAVGTAERALELWTAARMLSNG